MSEPKPKLSVIIVAKNESSNIQDCIASAAWAEEVIVLDSGSRDGTVELATQAGAKVIQTDWQGYGIQQNRGIDAANHEWIFSLDADERITPELAGEIRATIAKSAFQVFDVPRRSLFVSRFMRHSGWWPDRTKRLFKKDCGRFSNHEIHASLQTEYPIGHLQASMIHYSYRDFDSVLEKMNRYSSGSARDLYAKGKTGSLSKALLHGTWSFFRTYLIKLGFLDGKYGFLVAIVNAETTFWKYVKLSAMMR